MLIIFKLFFLVILLTLGISSLSLAPWVPSKKKDLKRINKLANLQPGQVFYDLGCGDGRITAYISKNSPGTAVGFELAIPFYFICKIRQLFSRQKNLKFKLKNLFHVNLRKVDVVYLFAASKEKLTGKIIKKLETELKPGAKVISYAFPISKWKPIIIDKPGKDDITIYLGNVHTHIALFAKLRAYENYA